MPSFIQYSSGSGIDESRSQKGGRKEISRVVTVIIPLRLGGRYHVQGQRHVLQLMRYINSSSEFAFSGLTGWFIGWNVPWVDMSGGIQHPELEVAASCQSSSVEVVASRNGSMVTNMHTHTGRYSRDEPDMYLF